MNNPYAAPQVDLAAPAPGDETYQPKLLQVSGRIGRMRYLAYSAAIGLLMIPVILAVFIMDVSSIAKGSVPGALIALLVVVGIAVLACSIILMRRRLNDMGRTGWFMLLFLVPLANLVFYLWILGASGDEGSNQYGPAPGPNTLLINIVGGFMLAVTLVSFVGNFIAGVTGALSRSSSSQSSGF
jgi:uncharacterized membrane protein YhaH (DUF805 family)